MKKILFLLFVLSFNSYAFAAGDDGGSSEVAYYDDAVKLIKRAGTYEKKINK